MAKYWIQKAVKKMKKKGTAGSFRKYCGGKVTMDCIKKAKNSPNESIRKKAVFAENMMRAQRKAEGGEILSSLGLLSKMSSDMVRPLSDTDTAEKNKGVLQQLMLTGGNPVEDAIDKVMMKAKNKSLKVQDVDDLFGYLERAIDIAKENNPNAEFIPQVENALNNLKQSYFGFKKGLDQKDFIDLRKDTMQDITNIYDMMKSGLGDKTDDIFKKVGKVSATLLPGKFAYGGDVYRKYPDGGEMPAGQEQAQQQSMQGQEQQSQQQAPQISYEEYVQFVMAYPEYFEQLIRDLQQQLGGQGQAQGQEQQSAPAEQEQPAS